MTGRTEGPGDHRVRGGRRAAHTPDDGDAFDPETRPARERRPVRAPRRRQWPGRRDDRPGAHGPAVDRPRGFRPDDLHCSPVVRLRLRRDQGFRGPCRWRTGRPLRPQARVGGGLAVRTTGPGPAHLGAGVGLDHRRQRPARHQPGTGVVEHGDHEDRPGRPDPPWLGDGPQRGGRLWRGGAHRPGYRVHRRTGRTPAGAVLPRAGSCRPGPRSLGPVRTRDAGARGP